MLLTPDLLQTFRLPNRLLSILEVSDRFYLKPLLRAVTFPQVAFVLALAQNSVRVIEVSADDEPAEVRVPDLPSDAASAAGRSSLADRAPTRRIQGDEGQKLRLRQYSRHIDLALRPFLNGLDVPLILAATEPLDSIFRSVNSYPHLAPESIAGNPEASSGADSGPARARSSMACTPRSSAGSRSCSRSAAPRTEGWSTSAMSRGRPPTARSTRSWSTSTTSSPARSTTDRGGDIGR